MLYLACCMSDMTLFISTRNPFEASYDRPPRLETVFHHARAEVGNRVAELDFKSDAGCGVCDVDTTLVLSAHSPVPRSIHTHFPRRTT